MISCDRVMKMPTDNYQNYIKHLESIIQMHENATKGPSGWVYSAEAYGILARAESAIGERNAPLSEDKHLAPPELQGFLGVLAL